LEDRYSRYLAGSADIVLGTISQIQKIQLLMAPATLQANVKSNGQIVLQCLAATSSSNPTLVAANPEAGSVLSFTIVMRNSSVGPFDN
jgi:hypothetical protein